MRPLKLGRYQAWAGCGALYLDRLPYRGPRSWRVVISRHPVWLPFSVRYGYRPGPRVYRLGPLDVAIYGRGDR